MKDSIRSKYIRKQMKLSLWQKRFLLAFAVVVAALTTYALMMPAITLESEYLCGKEAHVHGPGCYVADPETGELTLICDREEHVHDERCIVHDKNPERYICGHDYEHVHNENCYRNGVLVCTLTEHTHTDNCLADEYRFVMRASAGSELTLNPEVEAAGATEAVEEVETAEQTPPTEDATDGMTAEAQREDGEAVMAAAVGTEPGQESAENTEKNLDSIQLRGAPIETTEKKAETEEANEKETDETQLTTQDALSEEDEEISAAALRGDSYTVLENDPPFTTISFTVKKSGYNDPIDVNYMSGDGYSFELSITTDDFYGSTPTNRKFYTYDLDTTYNDVTLKYGAEDLIAYCASCGVPTDTGGILTEPGWAPLKNEQGKTTAYMKVTRTAENRYRFTFISSSGDSVDNLSVKGAVSKGATGQDVRVVKNAGWDTANSARRFSIVCTIPRYADDFSQYYYITDQTLTSGQAEPYSGFYENTHDPYNYANFQLSMTDMTTGQSYLVPELTSALEADPNGFQFAYKLVPDDATRTTKLYLFNRANHLDLPASDSHHDHAVSQYAGNNWCLCWQQNHDMQLTISYTDAYGKKYLMADSFVNNATLQGSTVNINGEHVPVDKTGTTGEVKKVLGKSYVESEHKFVMILNEEHHDLGTGSGKDLTINDTMTNCRIPAGYAPTVNRYDANDQLDNSGLVYSVVPSTAPAGGADSFVITISNPGIYKYEISYPVERSNSNSTEITNALDLVFQTNIPDDIRWSGNWDYGVSGATGYRFSLTWRKEYEDGIPPTGAVFTLYRAASPDGTGDRVIGISETKNDRRIEYDVGSADTPNIDLPYPASDGLDHVYFNNQSSISMNRIYCIKETTAPDNYEPSALCYYFVFTTENDLLDTYKNLGFSGSTSADGSSPQKVRILNQWSIDYSTNTNVIDFTVPTNLVNTKYKYDFPETGSSAGLLLRTTGVVLMLSPALLLLYRKRNKKQAATSPQPELH